ncbi:MAG: nucleotidyltransferase domain-containing protein [Prevotella sp.]|jgi:predicted nucleotidyltransferase|nr:nucleotidyltransferase domain-containing protein [Prevotella sp.]
MSNKAIDQKAFAEKAKNILMQNPSVNGLLAGGSWITDTMDEYSDVDLVVVINANRILGLRGFLKLLFHLFILNLSIVDIS